METYGLFHPANCFIQTQNHALGCIRNLQGNLSLARTPLGKRALPLINSAELSASMLEMLVQSRKAGLDHFDSNLRFKKISKESLWISCDHRGQLMPNGASPVCHPSNSSDDMTSHYEIRQMLESLLSQFRHLICYDLRSHTGKIPIVAATDNDATVLRQPGYFAMLSSKNLLIFCTESKSLSIEFQNHLRECSFSEVFEVSQKLSPFLSQLITHELGNYVIQRLASRDTTFQERLAAFCYRSLSKIINNEFASRVMQLLVELCPTFRENLQQAIAFHPDLGLGSNAAVYVVNTCIRHATSSSESKYILDWLRRNPNLIWKKGFQKLLTQFVMYCSETQLDEVFLEIEIEKYTESYMKVKLMGFILVNLVQRNHRPTIDALKQAFNNDPTFALTTVCFKLMISKSWAEQVSATSKNLSEILTSLSKSKRRRLCKKSHSRAIGYFYI